MPESKLDEMWRLVNLAAGTLMDADEMRLADEMPDAVATALAEAEARGRRQGLEEAARVAENRPDGWGADYKFAADLVSGDIRSLATAPAETQKPETGESHGKI